MYVHDPVAPQPPPADRATRAIPVARGGGRDAYARLPEGGGMFRELVHGPRFGRELSRPAARRLLERSPGVTRGGDETLPGRFGLTDTAYTHLTESPRPRDLGPAG